MDDLKDEPRRTPAMSNPRSSTSRLRSARALATLGLPLPLPAHAALSDTQKQAIDAAMQAATDAATGPAEMLDNEAQVALGDAITGALGGNDPTHSRGGGHKGSFTKDKSIQQQLSNIGAILNPNVRDAINEHLATAWSRYNV